MYKFMIACLTFGILLTACGQSAALADTKLAGEGKQMVTIMYKSALGNEDYIAELKKANLFEKLNTDWDLLIDPVQKKNYTRNGVVLRAKRKSHKGTNIEVFGDAHVGKY